MTHLKRESQQPLHVDLIIVYKHGLLPSAIWHVYGSWLQLMMARMSSPHYKDIVTTSRTQVKTLKKTIFTCLHSDCQCTAHLPLWLLIFLYLFVVFFRCYRCVTRPATWRKWYDMTVHVCFIYFTCFSIVAKYTFNFKIQFLSQSERWNEIIQLQYLNSVKGNSAEALFLVIIIWSKPYWG